MMMRRSHRIWTRFYSFGRSLRWEIEYELQPGWTKATWEIPSWAASPTASIIGDWEEVRRRFTWFHVPVSPWRNPRGPQSPPVPSETPPA